MSTLSVHSPYKDISLGTKPVFISGGDHFDDTSISGTVVKFTTNAPQGQDYFYVELYDDYGNYITTPLTVENFLKYVNNGDYAETIIHRSVKDFVIQGGGYSAPPVAADQPESNPIPVTSRESIINEPGNSNILGSLAMAKLANQPDSATNQWYFNLKDNTFLDSDNGGYTVFGRVIGEGLQIIEEIASAPKYDATAYYMNPALTDLPLWRTNPDNVVRPDDFVKIKSIDELEGESLLFSYAIKASDPDILDAIISNKGDITLTLKKPSSKPVEINVTATSLVSGEKINDNFLVNAAREYTFNTSMDPIVNEWLSSTPLPDQQNKILDDAITEVKIIAPGWHQSYSINQITVAAESGDFIQGKKLDHETSMPPGDQNVAIEGSFLKGSDGSDIVKGLSGWDVIESGAGDDLVRAGTGRDIISGGMGADELHGDFGWNTYTDQADGFVDLIAIKSDQFLVNWWYGTAGNSPNGEKADIIEKLDANDQIKIIGVATDDLSFSAAVAHGQDGIGIFANGVLEALYTGGDLSAAQLEAMTTGDASDAAINNQIWSYNFGNDIPQVL